MSMRTLIFSDLHLHNWPNCGLIDGINSRLWCQYVFLTDIAQYCTTNSIDRVVFCGDLFHTHGKIDTDVLNVASKGFYGIASNVRNMIILVGNHDVKGKNHSLNFLDKGNVDVVPHNTSTTTYAGYHEDYDDFQQTIEAILGWNYPAMFCHQGVKSVKLGSGFEIPNEFLDPNDIPSDKIAFTGHYHRHQVIGNVVIVGSSMQHTWADSEDDRGFIVADIDDNSVDWRFKPYLYSPRFTEIQEGQDEDLEGYHILRVRGGAPESYRRKLLERPEILSVELVAEEKDKSPSRVSAFGDTSISDLIESYEKDKKADKQTIKIGKQLRNNSYEIN